MMETVPSGTILYGRYRIERALGSGGFGHVYLAIDLRSNQQYAIKEYLVSGASGQAQLQHEARVLSQLHHPNLPAFHEAFNERGRYYVVLSYIEGNDLTDLIRVARTRNEPIPIARIMGWILSICDAVHFLHIQQLPIIHRDIKPDNIRIMPDGTAILVDLGNAKAAAGGERTLFFIRHQGTPGYAPQEQYPGGSGTDVRSDVYALGGTLYFALTAHEPPSVSTRNQSMQQGQNDLPSLQELLANNPPETTVDTARQFRLGVTKPSKPAPRHIRHLAQLGTLPPELLEQLSRIIRRAMAMKPKERYQTVADFSNDLRRVAAAIPAPPAAPARPVDPHGTQPDLPQLYDAIQAAADAGRPQNPPQQPPLAAINTCPRCGATLLPQASFCPRCGTSVNTMQNKNISSSDNTILPSTQSNKQVSTIADDQTRRITPSQMTPTARDSSAEQMTRNPPGIQAQQPAIQAMPPKFQPSVPPMAQHPSSNGTPFPTNPHVQSAVPTSTPPFPPRIPFQGSATQTPSTSPTRSNTSPAPAPVARNNAKLLLAIVAVLILVLIALVLVIIFIATHKQTGSAGIVSFLYWHSLKSSRSIPL